MSSKKSRIVVSLLCLFILFASFPVVSEAAIARSKTYTFYFDATKADYNITLQGGNMTSKPKVYYKNVFGKEVSAKIVSISGSSYSKTIKAGLENKKYYIKVDAKSKPACKYSQNKDKYSGSSVSSGISWQPTNASIHQPYTQFGVYVHQIAYVPRDKVRLYALNMDKNMYLKLIDTSVKISAILAMAHLSSASSLGKAITAMGRSNVAKITKEIATGVGGVTLLPKLNKMLLREIEKKSQNYSKGLKITVMWTQRAGFTNNYETWDGRASSVYGAKGYRGKFSTYKKLYGWY